MTITKENLIRHELIGLEAKVVGSSDPSLIGVHGKVSDETKETIVLRFHGDSKVIPKSNSVFVMRIPSGGEVKVDGSKLVGKPENRIKKVK